MSDGTYGNLDCGTYDHINQLWESGLQSILFQGSRNIWFLLCFIFTDSTFEPGTRLGHPMSCRDADYF